MALSLVTPPAAEPITSTEAKLHARIDHTEEDALVAGFIVGARELFEQETGRQIVTATWRYTLHRFPRGREAIQIPKAPLASVTEITYVDTAGEVQTWAATEYDVMAHAGPFAPFGTVQPKPGKLYPATYPAPDAVRVEFTAGVAAASVPAAIKGVLYQMVADQFSNREAQITGTIASANRTYAAALQRFRVPVYA